MGMLSNTQLYRTYGFTVGPDCERFFSYWLLPRHATNVYKAHLPENFAHLRIRLSSRRIDGSLRSALRVVREPCKFLQLLCEHCKARYDNDPDTLWQAARKAL